MRRNTALAFLFALSVLPATSVRAQVYPDRAVKIIVPFAAGGTADAVPRLVADWLSRKWGQPVIIENRTGAGGNIGADFAYRATPDGYTLFSSPPPPLVINQNLYPNLGFDPTKFEPVIVTAHVPNALIVSPKNLRASSVSELIEYLRQNPDKVTARPPKATARPRILRPNCSRVMAQGEAARFIPYLAGRRPRCRGPAIAGDVDLMFG